MFILFFHPLVCITLQILHFDFSLPFLHEQPMIVLVFGRSKIVLVITFNFVMELYFINLIVFSINKYYYSRNHIDRIGPKASCAWLLFRVIILFCCGTFIPHFVEELWKAWKFIYILCNLKMTEFSPGLILVMWINKMSLYSPVLLYMLSFLFKCWPFCPSFNSPC